jgi:hypothetical protein
MKLRHSAVFPLVRKVMVVAQERYTEDHVRKARPWPTAVEREGLSGAAHDRAIAIGCTPGYRQLLVPQRRLASASSEARELASGFCRAFPHEVSSPSSELSCFTV